jgi:hypothetical protein
MPKSMPIPNDDNCNNIDIASFTIDAKKDAEKRMLPIIAVKVRS